MEIEINTERDTEKLLGIYKSIFLVEEGDLTELNEIRKNYLSFYEEQKNKLFLHNKEEASKKKFNDDWGKNFSSNHKKLEQLVFTDATYACFQFTDSKWGQYIHLKLLLLQVSFAKRYEDFVIYYSCDEGFKKPVFYKDLPIKYETDLNKKISSLKKVLPKKKRITTAEIKIVKENILPYLQEYNQAAEKNFFRIKKFLKFYSKQIDIIFTKDLWPVIYLKKSSSIIVKVHDTIPAVSPRLESQLLQDSFCMMTVESALKTKSNILHLSKKSLFQEVLEIFFATANDEDKDKLIKNIFILLGYDVKEIRKLSLQITKRGNFFDNRDQNVECLDKEYVYLDYIGLGGEELDKIVAEIIKNKSEYSKFYLFSPRTYFNSRIKKITEIENLDVAKISNILFDSNLYQFVSEYIQDSILRNTDAEISSSLNLKKRGEEFIEELTKIPTGHKDFKKLENIVELIFEYLFKDSFRNYYYEVNSTEEDGHQIRDLVIHNISPESEFWKDLKREYSAREIIVDSKNYAQAVEKKIINDVAQYLDNGKSNVAIVVSREGITESGKKEQKVKYKKNQLVIHLSQEDLISMINHKINKAKVEDILELKIHEINKNNK
jgi:hypothetical protein